jgi:isopenicillin N synthase-like dioxygenase
MKLLAVPVIDIEPFRTGTAADRGRVAEAVDRACRDIGFLVIGGHGVDEGLIEHTRAVSRAFFDLPLAEKQRVARPARDVARGYIGLDEESLARSRDPSANSSDLNESLMIGPVDLPPAAYMQAPAAGKHYAPNLWPQQPAGRRQPAWPVKRHSSWPVGWG